MTWSSGRRLWLVVLIAVVSLSIATFVVGIVAAATLPPLGPDQENPYAKVQLALGVPCVMVGAFVVWHRHRHPIGWALVLAGWAAWWSAAGWAVLTHVTHPTWYVRPVAVLGTAGWLLSRGVLQVAVPGLYPDGWRWRSGNVFRRIGMVAGVAAIIIAPLFQALVFGTFDMATFQPASWSRPFADWLPRAGTALFVVAIVANVDLAVRVARMRGEDSVRHRLVAVAAVLLAVPGIVQIGGQFGITDGWNIDGVEFLAGVLLPVTVGWGVLRHGALGARPVARRAPVYAGVTIVAAAIYVAVVTVFSEVVQGGSGIGPVVATGVVATTFQPARVWVQRGLDRSVFGDRDEPYRALARIGRELGEASSESDPLSVLAEAVRSSLNLPKVRIERADGRVAAIAEAEVPWQVAGAESVRLPIAFEGRVVGELVAVLPKGETTLGVADRTLLSDLAGAAGAVVESVMLADHLASQRDALVRAREEERRRLRHDLHDGLGPTLASVAMGLDAAACRLADDEALASLLRDLDQALQEAIADIRRLVYGLRPPALDDLGLVPALREQAHDLAGRSRGPLSDESVEIEVVVDGELPSMEAAVEVAAYRIAVEGMTNVIRHSGARRCTVRLSAENRRDRSLLVSVEDDGRGIDAAAKTGIGFESMRNRAAELGGGLRVEVREGGGTLLTALLPLGERATP